MRGVHVCLLGCEAECSHGLVCEIGFGGGTQPHNLDRGKPRHYACDGELNHEWSGKAGRCTTSPLEDAEGD